MIDSDCMRLDQGKKTYRAPIALNRALSTDISALPAAVPAFVLPGPSLLLGRATGTFGAFDLEAMSKVLAAETTAAGHKHRLTRIEIKKLR